MNTVKTNTSKKPEASPKNAGTAPVKEHTPNNKNTHTPVTLKPETPEQVDKKLKASQPIEKNYPKHQKKPAVAEEAVFEENEDGAGSAMKWIIPLIVIGLVVLWYFMR